MSPAPRVGITPVPEPPYDEEQPTAQLGTPEIHGALALDPRPLVWGPPGAIPDERKLRHLGQALAEVLAGRRPPETVADKLTARAYRELVQAGQMIQTARPPFAGSVHVKEPREGAVEMCLLIHCGERNHVLAIRLERRGVQWLCTDFETA
ncbi:Rv3235 family protein [Nonomuraea sp. NPDC049784]|uniref:Rv3235 family protein n=1 Tax=Nonomuraea sp. NPDC049784 TaxID=3154361 RepID=UPI0033F95419